MPLYVQDYNGYAVAKKISGSAGAGGTSLAVGTQVMVPFSVFGANNPTNIAYPLLVNKSASVSNAVAGIRSPVLAIQAPVKASWWTAALINSWLSLDVWAWGISDGTTLRTFDGCCCAGINLVSQATGGVIGLDIAFMALYDSKFTSGWTFSTFSTPSNDPGYLMDVNAISFNSTADQVSAVAMSILRARGYLDYFDKPVAGHHVGISTGITTGSMGLVVSPSAATVPSSGATLRVGTTGAGIQFAASLSLDNDNRVYVPALGTDALSYSMVDLTGNGNVVLITAM